MASSTRDAATVKRLLRRRGAVLTYQRLVATKDKAKGSQAWAPSGSPIQALTAVLSPREITADNQTRGDVVLLVDGPPFSAVADLSEDWQVTLPSGAIHRIIGQVAVLRTTGAGSAAYFEAFLQTGGG